MASWSRWIDLAAEALWMVLLQPGLLKVQYYTRQNPRLKPLSTFEICSVVAVSWLFYMAFASTARGLLGLVLPSPRAPDALGAGEGAAGPRYGARFLFYRTLWASLLHRGVTFALEKIIPLWHALRADSEAVQRRIRARSLEVVAFMRAVEWGRGPVAGGRGLWKVPAFEKAACQAIGLQRRKSQDAVGGERTLSWDIAVDKQALDEMKETLGPPGGFGEMGFHVTGEGVCFEAMGIGTRFNLSFSLQKPPSREQGPRSPKKKRKSL